MTTLKETALNHVSKKELWHLPSVSVDVEIKEANFTGKEGKDIPYKYIEVNGYKYTVNAKLLSALKTIVSARPDVKNVKFQRDDNNQVFVVPLD